MLYMSKHICIIERDGKWLEKTDSTHYSLSFGVRERDREEGDTSCRDSISSPFSPLSLYPTRLLSHSPFTTCFIRLLFITSNTEFSFLWKHNGKDEKERREREHNMFHLERDIILFHLEISSFQSFFLFHPIFLESSYSICLFSIYLSPCKYWSFSTEINREGKGKFYTSFSY